MLKTIQSFYYLGPKGEGPSRVTFKCVCLEAKSFKVHLSSFLFTVSVVHSNPETFSCFEIAAKPAQLCHHPLVSQLHTLLCLAHDQQGS